MTGSPTGFPTGSATTTKTSAGSRFDAARQVADAVLLEGYVLYPYRASAAKNRLRWQFGVLVPPPGAARTRSTSSSRPRS